MGCLSSLFLPICLPSLGSPAAVPISTGWPSQNPNFKMYLNAGKSIHRFTKGLTARIASWSSLKLQEWKKYFVPFFSQRRLIGQLTKTNIWTALAICLKKNRDARTKEKDWGGRRKKAMKIKMVCSVRDSIIASLGWITIKCSLQLFSAQAVLSFA